MAKLEIIEIKSDLRGANAVDSYASALSTEQLNARGDALAYSLGVTKNKNGLYPTAWGNKTGQGFYLTVLNNILDIEARMERYDN